VKKGIINKAAHYVADNYENVLFRAITLIYGQIYLEKGSTKPR